MLLVTSVAFWFAANRLLDEAPAAGRDEFLVSPLDDIPHRQNIAIGLLGLSAPRGADFIDYGSGIADLYRIASYAQIGALIRGPDTLHTSVDPLRNFCWLYAFRTEATGCLPFEQTPQVLETNAELLRRFRSLQQMHRFSDIHGYSNVEYIDVTRLAVADILVHLAQGEHDIAYRKWRDQLGFAINIVTGSGGLLAKTSGRIIFHNTLVLLDDILAASPGLARRYASELERLLRVDGIRDFNLDGILRADYAGLKRALDYPPPSAGGYRDRLRWLAFHFGQEQRILNRYLAFARDYAELLQQPLDGFDDGLARLLDKHMHPPLRDWLIDPFGTLFLYEYMRDQRYIGELLVPLHAIDGELRLAALLVQITLARPRDDEIPAFIAAAGPNFHDPYRQDSMKWDAGTRTIYFPSRTDSCVARRSFRVVDVASREQMPPLRAATKFC